MSWSRSSRAALATLVFGSLALAAPRSRAGASMTTPELVPPGAGTCPGGMRFVPGGSYTLVETKEDATVRGFCIDAIEVTVAAYEACAASGACTAPISECVDPDMSPDTIVGCSKYCNVGHADRLDQPVNCVDWNQATRYCAAQGK